MKRFCKYFFISAIGLFAFLLTALHFSWFQKFCLYSLLRTRFQDVQLLHFQGGPQTITADRIALKNEQGTVVLHSILLEWKPWQLLLKRTLHIQNLQLKAVIQMGAFPTSPIQHTAGWGLVFSKKPQPFSFFQYLQPPFPVHLEKADLCIEKSHLLHWSIDSLQIHVRQLVPRSNGTIQYSTSTQAPFSDAALLLRTQGNVNLQTDPKGIWEKMAVKGTLHLQNGEQTIPPVTYAGTVAKMEPAPKEQIKIHLHSGQANDFTLVGETLKTADHWVEFQSQGNFDQTFLQIFNLPHTPILSVFSKSTSRLHRKTHQWQNNLQLSIYAKDFDPNLSSLPMVHLKAHFDTECDAHQIQLNQYDLQLKEWNGSRLLFSMHSLQPLRYHFKEGLQGLKRDTQLFTLTFYEIPFEIFNPYLQTHGYRIQGNSNSGHIAVLWENQSQQFNLQTLQPLTFHIRQLDRNETPILSNIQGKLQGQATLQNPFSHLQYKGSLTLSNLQQMPFLQWATQGNYHTSDPSHFSSAGTLDFRQDWAKDCLSLQAFSWGLHPELQGHATYEIAQKKDKKLEEWNLKDLHIHLSSSVTEQPWLSVQLQTPITVKNDTLFFSSTEPFLTIRAQQLPLDTIRHADCEVQGKLSLEANFSAHEKEWIGIIKPTTLLSSVTASFQQKPLVDWKRITLEETRGTYSPQKGWSLTLNGLQAFSSSETIPFFQTQFQCHGKGNQIQASNGQCKAQLDELSLQPFALSYPGFAGNFISHWDWSEKKKSIHSHLYATCTDLPFTADVQANYQQTPEKDHQLQGQMELQHAAHKSDVTFDHTLNAKNQLTGKWISQQLFLQDMVGFGVGIGKIAQKFSQKPSASTSTPSLTSSRSSSPSHPLQGTCDFHCQSIVDLAAQSIEGHLSFDPQKISFQLPKGKICQGNVQTKATFEPLTSESHVDLSLQNVDLKTIWELPSHFGSSLESYGKLQGTASGSLQVAGNFTEPQTLHGNLSLQANDGAFDPKTTALDKGQAVAGISNLVGMATGQTLPASSSVGFLSSYLQTIPFSNLSVEVQRLPQKPMVFQAYGINPDLSVAINGSFETQPFCPWNQQPFVGHIQFRAPQQSPFAQYFHFDPKKTDANGYNEGPQCTIDGTLKKPNYLALLQLLTQTSEPANDPSDHPVTNLLQNSPIHKILDLL